jgi:ABC-type dipeptide/oligopeptide/nickel transport system permease component
MGITMVISIMTMVANILIDLVYVWINPTITIE